MKVLYAGSFDPFTIGHKAIAQTAVNMFGELVIGVGFNESKNGEWPVEIRVKAIRELFRDFPDVEVLAYSGLTAVFAKKIGASALIRGLRNSLDFEKEKELADINFSLTGIQTVFIPSSPQFSFISSSMVRELLHNGYDASKYIAGNFPVRI